MKQVFINSIHRNYINCSTVSEKRFEMHSISVDAMLINDNQIIDVSLEIIINYVPNDEYIISKILNHFK